MSWDSNADESWPITDEVHGREDAGRMFGMFSYYKGAAVVRMMESVLTKESFTRGIQSYVQDLSYGTAVEEQLFMHLEVAAREDGRWPQPGWPGDREASFEKVMKTWTNQVGT